MNLKGLGWAANGDREALGSNRKGYYGELLKGRVSEGVAREPRSQWDSIVAAEDRQNQFISREGEHHDRERHFSHAFSGQ